MKIHSIQLKNFKQFSELSIERDSGGDIYLIGDNDKGKTTIIQAIFGCLKQISLPTSVIKNGEKEGEVHLKIGDNAQEYHVKLRMTEKGETLTLT